MTTPYTNFVQQNFQVPTTLATPNLNGRGRGTGAKRGRKPKVAGIATGASSPRPQTPLPTPSTSQATPLQWSQPISSGANTSQPQVSIGNATQKVEEGQAGSNQAGPSSVLLQEGAMLSVPAPGTARGTPALGGEDEGEGEDETLPAMADDDYSAQLSWQSQSKENMKVLMDNFTPEQYDRFEAYRRHALPKQAVRKVVQQALGQQVSQPIAQIIAGVSKVFVGEIVEKARVVQSRRGETGPLSPDHLREAYRMYQQETGRVGAARPVRAKRIFVR